MPLPHIQLYGPKLCHCRCWGGWCRCWEAEQAGVQRYAVSQRRGLVSFVDAEALLCLVCKIQLPLLGCVKGRNLCEPEPEQWCKRVTVFAGKLARMRLCGHSKLDPTRLFLSPVCIKAPTWHLRRIERKAFLGARSFHALPLSNEPKFASICVLECKIPGKCIAIHCIIVWF